MTLRELADSIGIGQYNEILEAAYAKTVFTDEPAVDIALIDRLQEDYKLFGDYYDVVRSVGTQINADENRSRWVKFTAQFVKDSDADIAKKVPAPAFDGTVISNMLPFYTHLPSIPLAMEEYRSRGFTEDEAVHMLRCYRVAMGIAERRTGLPGMNKTYYNWDINYTKVRIFETDGLQFELRTLPDAVVYIQNKTTGQVIPVMNQGVVHRTGIQMLGSEGFEDEEGAFQVQFREDEEAFYGHGVFDSRVDLEEKTFPKSQWQSYLRPGQECLSMHIPAGTNITPEAVAGFIKTGRDMTRRHFPEHKGMSIYCSSWIMDPQLVEMLGPDAKITAFSNLFVKYPQKVDGNGVFLFVFSRKPEDLNELEENTSLQRKLKKLYLEGGHILPYAGIITE